mmetsp:Transcript_5328/g.11745  ORF Transcript_5328/g.11745 Transcript_5328/m.11745 type:complete len:166 (+) Transcript_5328:238-735(+)
MIAANNNNNNNNDTSFAGETESQRKQRIRRNNRRRIRSSGIVVPDGHIWVEGDNPWNSSDSRNYGAVPASLITGRVLCRIWPLRGNAMMQRGDRPSRNVENGGDDDGDGGGRPSLAFSGSIVIPAGWDDQRIVREYRHVPVSTPAPMDGNDNVNNNVDNNNNNER